MPAVLRAALDSEEAVLRAARTTDDELLAATRFGLWRVVGETVSRWDWHRIAKARLANSTLELTLLEDVGQLGDNIVLTRNAELSALELAGSTRLTDEVHDRIRRSVAASQYLPWEAGGCWVVLRRVPGHDGLVNQICLDNVIDPKSAGFAQAAENVISNLRHSMEVH